MVFRLSSFPLWTTHHRGSRSVLWDSTCLTSPKFTTWLTLPRHSPSHTTLCLEGIAVPKGLASWRFKRVDPSTYLPACVHKGKTLPFIVTLGGNANWKAHWVRHDDPVTLHHILHAGIYYRTPVVNWFKSDSNQSLFITVRKPRIIKGNQREIFHLQLQQFLLICFKWPLVADRNVLI